MTHGPSQRAGRAALLCEQCLGAGAAHSRVAHTPFALEPSRACGDLRIRACALMLLALGAIALAGCATDNKPIFSPLREPLVWPKPPETARIRYVGEISGEASLNRAKTGGQVLRELFTGPTPMAGFSTPLAVAVDGETVFVADPACPTGPAVHVLSLGARSYSQITQVAGETLQWPIDVALQNGQLAIADAKRATVYVRSAGAQSFTAFGRGVLQRPASAAWSSDGGELWVVDAGSHSVVVFDTSGQLRYTIGGQGNRPGLFNFPTAVCVAGGGEQSAVIVADAMNFRVQVLDVVGQPVRAFGKKGDAAGDFALPRDVAVDRDGHVFVLDNQFENVQVFERDGRLLMAWGSEGEGPGQFNLPTGITIDAQDQIWVADTYNRRVQVFQYVREAEAVKP